MSKNNTDLNTLINTYNGYYTKLPGDSMQDAARSIAMTRDRENASQALTQYALKLPINEIATHVPEQSTFREQQMMALFRAYQNGNIAGSAWRKIDETNNTMDIMQYVLSKDPRFKYEGPIYVSQDDITAVARISLASKNMVKQVKSGKEVEGLSRWDTSISMKQMLDSANMLVGMANVMREQSGQSFASLSKVLPNDVTEIVVKGVVADKVNGIDSFSKLSEKQRTGILAKATNLLSRAIEMLGKNNPNKNNEDIQK